MKNILELVTLPSIFWCKVEKDENDIVFDEFHCGFPLNFGPEYVG